MQHFEPCTKTIFCPFCTSRRIIETTFELLCVIPNLGPDWGTSIEETLPFLPNVFTIQ